MKKIIIANFEKLMIAFIVIVIGYALVDSMIIARDQMYLSEAGAFGVMTFVLSFVSALIVDLAKAFFAIAALYLLWDIRALLVSINQKKQ